MKLKNQIQKPFLISIILFPILLILLFNICAYVYSYNQGKNDLLEASEKLENDINNFLDYDSNTEEIINIITSALSTNNIELLVISESEDVLYPTDLENSFLNNEIIKELKLNDLEINALNNDGDIYHYVSIEKDLEYFNGDILYVARGYITDGFLEAVNIILIISSIILVIIFLIISNRTAKKISKPLEKISRILPKMNPNEIILLENNTNTEEINILSNEVNKMSKRIYNSNNIQKEFLQNISHEIRTPLTNIKGYNEAMQQGIFDKDTIYDVIESETNKINDYIEKFLVLSKLETIEYKLSKINIDDIFNELLVNLNGLAKVKNKKISYNNDIKDTKLNINKELIEQVINNLLVNAIKYSKKNIDIKTTILNDKYIITIKDDGKGIDENLDRIFDRFYKGNDGNFGLGLAIVKESLDLMNGEIKAYNDNGLCFEITLPLNCH